MLRHAAALTSLIVVALSSDVTSSPWIFPVDPSANVDEMCMFDCARSSNYDNNCYWKCGIDPLCKWGSMLQCADAKPDRQLNCVVDTGCLDFVQHYIRKKQQTHQGSIHTSNIIRSDLNIPIPQTSNLSTYVIVACIVFILLTLSVILTWVSIRKEGETKARRQPTADCYVLLSPEQGV